MRRKEIKANESITYIVEEIRDGNQVFCGITLKGVDHYIKRMDCKFENVTLSSILYEDPFQKRLEKARKDCLKAKKDECKIFNIDEVVYDKEILNHPELLKYLTENFGNLDRVLSINDLVCPELIAEAKANDDMELLLAGFNSAVDGFEYA
jgi:hypothetical protein